MPWWWAPAGAERGGHFMRLQELGEQVILVEKTYRLAAGPSP